MSICRELDALVTECVDGVASPEERRKVDAHLEKCAQCRQRANAERAVRSIIRARAQIFRAEAPPGLTERCRALATSGPTAIDTPIDTKTRWRPAVGRLPLAAGSAGLERYRQAMSAGKVLFTPGQR